MAKKVIVQGDPVSGSDTHHVKGTAAISPPPGTADYTGTATYPYEGTVSDALSGSVTIGGVAVATVDSRSSLRSPHVVANGIAVAPPAVPPTFVPTPTDFTGDARGAGAPGGTAGSGFVTIGGVAVLLDGDAFDTCGGERGSANSTVHSAGQSFVTVAG